MSGTAKTNNAENNAGKIDWKKKLTSRKLWAALCALATNLIIAFGGSQETAVQVTAIIMAGASVIAYIVGEGLVDAAYAGVESYTFNSYTEPPDDDFEWEDEEMEDPDEEQDEEPDEEPGEDPEE